jgi:hypothetical protein
MQTRDILYEQWPPFFNDFSRLHQGEHVNVETIGEGSSGVESRLHDLPLIGIVSAHPKGDEDEWIQIIACGSPGSPVTHSIEHPSNVQLAEEENGRAVALQIESAGGCITMVRFEPSRENLPPGYKVS